MADKQQILHVISELDGYATSSQLRLLVGDQIAAGQQVEIAALRARASILCSWRSGGIQCHHFQRRWRFDPFASWRLANFVNQRRPDLVHVWDTDAARNIALARRWAGKARLAATLAVPPPGRAKFLGLFDRVVVPTEELCQEYQDAIGGSVHIEIVPPGVSADLSHRYARESFLQSRRLPTDAQLIVVVGPLVRNKRLDEAIWHFELVRTLNENAVMLILGDGPERQRLERYVRLVSEPAVVKFLGYCEDMPAYLSFADVVWHTGEENAISVAVLESMAAGVPVVASDVPVNRTLIEVGKTGFLAAAGSRAMFARYTLRLLEDPELAEPIGKAAAEAAERRFSTSRMIEGYRSLYGELLST